MPGQPSGPTSPKRCQLHGDIGPPRDELTRSCPVPYGVWACQPATGLPGRLEASGRKAVAGVDPLASGIAIEVTQATTPAAALPRSEPLELRFAIPGGLALHHGGQLAHVNVACRLAGPVGAPVVAVMGGISAGRRVADTQDQLGWWEEVVGPGMPLDTERFQVLGLDFLGGSHDTTGPQGDASFPTISTFDQAEILRHALDHAGIAQLHACVGASYGGMVALALAVRHPQRVQHIVVISAAHRAHPMSTAWRSVQRAIVRYALTHRDGPRGLQLARALAMATYRSAREFEERFRARPSTARTA